MDGLRDECSIAALWRREAIAQSLYDKSSNGVLEDSKKHLSGEAKRQTTYREVMDPRREMRDLEDALANVRPMNRRERYRA